MREIKFRGWWHAAKKMYLVSGIDFDANHKMNAIELLEPIEHTYHITEDVHQVELMQYTGLKDCKGQEIYEGDIVKFGLDGEKEDRIGAIGYTFSDFVIYSLAQKYPNIRLSDAIRLEVIGNIYEKVKYPGKEG